MTKGGGFSPVKPDHGKGRESGKCHTRWGIWLAEREPRGTERGGDTPYPPPARPNTIFRGFKENSECTGGRAQIIINTVCVCVDGFNLIVFS